MRGSEVGCFQTRKKSNIHYLVWALCGRGLHCWSLAASARIVRVEFWTLAYPTYIKKNTVSTFSAWNKTLHIFILALHFEEGLS